MGNPDKPAYQEHATVQQSLNAWEAAADLDAAMFVGPNVIRRVVAYVRHLESLLGDD